LRVLWRSFVVSARADRERTFTCNLEMVQSPAATEGAKNAYVLHWPQPGLRARDPSRGSRLERIGYFGELKNLGAAYRDQRFLAELALLNVELIVREDPAQWADYSDIDIVLAVRDGSPYFLASKPATKLFNAWLAGCPAMVGGEPAFFHHRQSELDFIAVTSPQQVLAHLRRLRANPDEYLQLVEHAHRRAGAVTEDHVVESWLGFIQDIASPRYLQWSSRTTPLRHARSIAALCWGIFRAFLRGNRYRRGYDLHGNRVEKKRSALRRAAWALDDVFTKLER
jgi:hypothetical protein